MARDPRFDVLFEPVPIGPVTARNRFFQVPHCNGMGHRDPSALAAMRGVKAEGGWAVVSTEEVEIHPSSETSPHVEGRLWDETDLPAHRLVVDAIHRHGVARSRRAGAQRDEPAEPLHPRPAAWARVTQRSPPTAARPVQARRMSQRDIDDLRRWHREARSSGRCEAGYDIVYVYAGHSLRRCTTSSPHGSTSAPTPTAARLENRARLLREVLEETREVVRRARRRSPAGSPSTSCATTASTGPQTEELLGLLGELPDLWDFTVGEWDDDSVTSRFGPEGGQEEYVRGLKALTTQAGRRRRAVHLARHDGAHGPRRASST